MRRKIYWAKRVMLTLLLLGLLAFIACGEEETSSSRRKKSEKTEETEESKSSKKKKKDEESKESDGDADVEQQESSGEISGDEQTEGSEPTLEDTEQGKESASEEQDAEETGQDTKQDPYAYYDRLDELYQMQKNSIHVWPDSDLLYWYPIEMRLTGDKLYLERNYLSKNSVFPKELGGINSYMVCYDRNSKEFTSALRKLEDDKSVLLLQYFGSDGPSYGAGYYLGYDTDGYYCWLFYQGAGNNYKFSNVMLYCDYEGNTSQILELDDFYVDMFSFGLQKDSWVLCVRDEYNQTICVIYEDGRMETPIFENAVREAAHGLTEEVKVNCEWFDTNYAYGVAYIPNEENEYYYCDLTSANPLKWVQVDKAEYDSDLAREKEEEKNRQVILTGYRGGYATGIDAAREVICAYNEEDMESSMYYYFGGKEHIVLHDGSWYRMQIPGDGSKIDFSKYQPLSRETMTDGISPIDDTYYLVKDQYGVFLRKYETGEDWEEPIVMFEQ